MVVLLYSHEACLHHDAGVWHPERPERIGAVVRGVHRSGEQVEERTAPAAEIEFLHAIHHPSYVERIRQLCEAGGGPLDADTSVVAESWEAARRAAGAGPAAVKALRAGDGDLAVLAIRPPGHHALVTQAMGFCVFNNIALTAQAIAAGGERVAIFDWDVHHGNGTQESFYERSDVLYVSIHEFPFYPGSGWIDEQGEGDGEGFTVNVPFPAGTAGDLYDAAFDAVVVPILTAFSPDWILVSAGYDAHAADPLADLRLEEADYARMANRLVGIVPSGRTVLFLEGGYDLAAIEASVVSSIRGFAGDYPERNGAVSPDRAWNMFKVAAATAAAHWALPL
jgi:acetoin utilization deacetylase AcuC-like enzyme